LHLAVATKGAWYELDLDEHGPLDSGTGTQYTNDQPEAPQGITRTADGYVIGAAPDKFVSVTSQGPPELIPSGVRPDSGLVFFGSSYTSRGGGIIAFDTLDGKVDHFTIPNGSFSLPSPVARSRWPLARGDGFIYGLASQLRAVTEVGSDQPDGGIADVVVCTDCSGTEPPSNGLVNGGGGTIVAAPVGGTSVRVYVPTADDGGPPRSVVLSPFFDRF
jgi:hypothetical protein